VREKFAAALESTENWLYEDGFDAVKSVYQEKLNEVRKIGDPIVARFRESSSRPNAVKSLQDAIEQYRQWLYTVPTDENLVHITSEEQEKCHGKCDEISAWIYDLLDQQGSLSNDSDPVLKVEDINAKLTELHNVVGPVMRKPKLTPTKLDEKKNGEESKAAENGDKKQSDGPAPMETDDSTPPEAMDTTQ
jgi:hypothetical protein